MLEQGASKPNTDDGRGFRVCELLDYFPELFTHLRKLPITRRRLEAYLYHCVLFAQ